MAKLYIRRILRLEFHPGFKAFAWLSSVMPWKKLLAWATGQIDETLRQKLEFVLEANRVYRALFNRHSPHWRPMVPVSGCKFAVLLVGFGPIT